MKTKIAVVGNCQSRPIAFLLEKAFLNVEITVVAVVHLLKSEQVNDYMPKFKDADFIITQYIADQYPCDFIRTSVLSEEFGSKVIKIHNLFYKGYTPELRYLRLKGKGTLTGPLGDYHNEFIFEGWQKGASKQEIITSIKNFDIWEQRYAKVHGESIDELKNREKQLDIDMADDIEERLKGSRLFFTFNHPSKFLLFLMVSKVAVLMSLKKNTNFDFESMKEPLNQFNLPISSFTKHHLCLNFDDSEIPFKGVAQDENGKWIVPKNYSLDELIEAFMSVYHENESLIKTALVIKKTN